MAAAVVIFAGILETGGNTDKKMLPHLYSEDQG